MWQPLQDKPLWQRLVVTALAGGVTVWLERYIPETTVFPALAVFVIVCILWRDRIKVHFPFLGAPLFSLQGIYKSESSLTIHSAKYGLGDDAHGKDQYVDVKTILEGYIKHGRIDVPVDNNTFNGDPFPNRRKHARVTYSIGGGQKQTITRHEHNRLVIPDDSATSGSEESSVKELNKESRLRRQAELELSVKQDEIKGLSEKLATAKASHDHVQTALEQEEAELKREKEEFLLFKRQHGQWRIDVIGKDCTPRNLGVSVQFMDPKDSDLAKQIRSFFFNEAFAKPWRALEIEHILWKENPNPKARVVIFCDLDIAGGITAAFRHCALITEAVAFFPASMNPVEQTDIKDIAIIIFNKIGRIAD